MNKPLCFKLSFFLLIILLPNITLGQDSFAQENNMSISIPDNVVDQIRPVLSGQKSVESISTLLDSLYRQSPEVAHYIVNSLIVNGNYKTYTKPWGILMYYNTRTQLESFIDCKELEILDRKTNKLISYFQEVKDYLWLSKSYSLLSIVRYDMSYCNRDTTYLEASKANFTALEIITKHLEIGEASLSILGEIYLVKGRICVSKKSCGIEDAIKAYNKGLNYYALNNDFSGQANVLLNKALTFCNLKIDNDSSYYQESPMEYFEKAINVGGNDNILGEIKLNYAIYLQDKFLSTNDTGWIEKSNQQLSEILELSGSKKSEAYFQLVMNSHSYLSYFSSHLSREEKNNIIDTLFFFYDKALSKSKEEENLKVYNDIFVQLSTTCPYLKKQDCNMLLHKIYEVKSFFLQRNIATNRQVTEMNDQLMIAIDQEKSRNVVKNVIIFFLALVPVGIILFVTNWIKDLKIKRNSSIYSSQQDAITSFSVEKVGARKRQIKDVQGGFVYIEMEEKEKSVFCDLLVGFKEYAKLKGYTINFSVDNSIVNKVGFKFTVLESEVNISTNSVREDIKEYLSKVKNDDPLDELPVIISLQEHELIITVMKNRISFLKHSYELERNAKEFYLEFMKKLALTNPVSFSPSIFVQTGGSVSHKELSKKLTNNSYENINDYKINISNSFNKREEQINKLDEIKNLLITEDEIKEYVRIELVRNLLNLKEELEGNEKPDKGRVEKGLEKIKSLMSTLVLSHKTVKAFQWLFESFGLI